MSAVVYVVAEIERLRAEVARLTEANTALTRKAEDARSFWQQSEDQLHDTLGNSYDREREAKRRLIEALRDLLPLAVIAARWGDDHQAVDTARALLAGAASPVQESPEDAAWNRLHEALEQGRPVQVTTSRGRLAGLLREVAAAERSVALREAIAANDDPVASPSEEQA